MMTFMLWACTEAPLGITYQDTLIPAIDIHLHTGEWEDIPGSSQDYLSSRFPFPFGLTASSLAEDTLSSEGIVRELDKGGLHYGILLAVYAPRSVGVTRNEFVIDSIEKSERLYGMASLSVEQWSAVKEEQLEKLRAALAHPKMVGVKLAHTHMHFRMDDSAYYPIYEIAGELNAPVYVHTGSSPFPGTTPAAAYTDPRYLEEAIVAYPNTDFILGHMCYNFIEESDADLDNCFSLASRYENVWLEPSALGSRSLELVTKVYQKAKDFDVVGKMIYGSDGPQSPGFVSRYVDLNIQAMQEVGYSIEEATAVLSGNAIRVYGLPAVDI